MIKSLVMPAFNKDLASQARYLEVTLLKCETVREVLERIPELGLPDWYIGAGAVTQTVWNELHGFPLDTGIRDCDVVYFDPDTSFEAEDKVIQAGNRLFASLTVDVEIRNEARVHLWYEQIRTLGAPGHITQTRRRGPALQVACLNRGSAGAGACWG